MKINAEIRAYVRTKVTERIDFLNQPRRKRIETLEAQAEEKMEKLLGYAEDIAKSAFAQFKEMVDKMDGIELKPDIGVDDIFEVERTALRRGYPYQRSAELSKLYEDIKASEEKRDKIVHRIIVEVSFTKLDVQGFYDFVDNAVSKITSAV